MVSRPITEAEAWAAERAHVAARRDRGPVPGLPIELAVIAFLIGTAICWTWLSHA